jgi:SH3-like domain-containing protein
MAFSFPAFAQEQGDRFRDTELPLPRFVSLGSDRIYLRTGPGLRYPVRWVYQREGLPVEITREFDTWRKIRDIDGEEGWVHKSLISGRRTVLVTSDAMISMYREPSLNSQVTARIEPRAILGLETCDTAWCEIDTQGFRGWVQRNFLYGIYETEVFN